MELVRVSEAAALAAARWQGRGDGVGVNKAGAEAARVVLNTVQMDGLVVIGEGEKDTAAALYNGERLGTAEDPATDIAVKPVEGQTLVTQGRSNGISVIAIAERGTMFDPGPCQYMEKIVVSAGAKGVIDLDRPPAENVKAVAHAMNEKVRDITVVILDRPRHQDLIAEVRKSGARIRLIQDGDVAGALSALWPGAGADMLYGIGGTAEGVITAAALRCIGGDLQGRLWSRNNEDRQRALGAGYDLDIVMNAEDLVKGNDCFFAATGITDGNLLKGVRYTPDTATTESMVMRSKSGTVRQIQAQHRLARLAQFSEVDYE